MKMQGQSRNSFLKEQIQNSVFLLQRFLQLRSVTPEDGGMFAFIQDILEELGFSCTMLFFGPEGRQTPNLFAVKAGGEAGDYICFAGHTDVVPVGQGWSVDPFSGVVKDGMIFGRGAVDMKGGLACMIAAVARHLQKKTLKGKIAFLLTGDEEGAADFGTKEVLKYLHAQKEKKPDFCLLAEPTSVETIGDVLKIGRRGSLNAVIKVQGKQGHVAYPHLAENPVPVLLEIVQRFLSWRLDEGSDYFEPSSLQFTALKTSEGASNIIPAEACAHFNIRFNDCHSGETLSASIREVIQKFPQASVEISISGESFLTTAGKYVQRLEKAVEQVKGRRPRRETGGGTSDARFISKCFPVAELGLKNKTMHGVDERTSLEDVEELTEIFEAFLS